MTDIIFLVLNPCLQFVLVERTQNSCSLKYMTTGNQNSLINDSGYALVPPVIWYVLKKNGKLTSNHTTEN